MGREPVSEGSALVALLRKMESVLVRKRGRVQDRAHGARAAQDAPGWQLRQELAMPLLFIPQHLPFIYSSKHLRFLSCAGKVLGHGGT